MPHATHTLAHTRLSVDTSSHDTRGHNQNARGRDYTAQSAASHTATRTPDSTFLLYTAPRLTSTCRRGGGREGRRGSRAACAARRPLPPQRPPVGPCQQSADAAMGGSAAPRGSSARSRRRWRRGRRGRGRRRSRGAPRAAAGSSGRTAACRRRHRRRRWTCVLRRRPHDLTKFGGADDKTRDGKINSIVQHGEYPARRAHRRRLALREHDERAAADDRRHVDEYPEVAVEIRELPLDGRLYRDGRRRRRRFGRRVRHDDRHRVIRPRCHR